MGVRRWGEAIQATGFSQMSITIKIKENGPYFISLEDAASVVIVDSAGNRVEPAPGKAIVLCRCGHSSHKPFCDATHRTCGFQGALAVPETAAAPTAPAPPIAQAPPSAPPTTT